MASNYRLDYSVDLVLCIDATSSMGPVIKMVKQNALNFYRDLMGVMAEKNKTCANLRVRVIAFRDYKYDREDAMLVTDFFELPAQAGEFEACVKSIEPMGGGDDPEDGLEALAYAMKSKWNRQAVKKRHVIAVWSDDGTHELGFGKEAPNYPNGMAKNFAELTQWWGNRSNPGVMDDSAKRLLLFTPSKANWTNIQAAWNNVIHYESEAGNGLIEHDYKQILNAIVNSI